jgi:putative transposase
LIDSATDEVIVIKLFDRCALPFKRTQNEIIQAISLNEAQVLQIDPYSSILRPENEIPESHRKYRDEAWELIKELSISDDKYFLLYKTKRGPIVASLARKTGRSKKVIYDYLRRCWQAGGMKNALLPAFDHCGGRGKRRLAKTPNSPKLGRKSAIAKTTGKQQGVRITPDIERRFEKGIRRFYETSNKRNFSDAFQLTLEKFFNNGFAIVGGAPTPILPPNEDLPSLRQFRYWYENIYRDIKREKISRYGEREYNLQSRELLSDSTQMAFGPSSVYQIDATISDIFLVSSLDRTRIIGRPITYHCIDVFSRVLTGFCVTLEGPSWLGAMLALDNVMMDKVAFCAEYGISIQSDEWPCNHIPDGILADRGEFAGYNASTLVNTFRTKIHNTAPYRADWKGIVERSFGLSKERFIKFMPGHVPQFKKRGDPEYALSAAVTLNEFRKLMIFHALNYNMNHYMKWYRKDEFMIATQVERYPLDIWNWGIVNRSGHLRTLTQNIIRLNLLPRKQVTVTARGIHFEGELFYTCDLAMREGWFARARERGSWRIEAAFDLRTTDQIYLPLDGQRLEVCHLTPASIHLRGRDWHEVTDYFALENIAEQTARARIRQSDASLRAQQEQIISEAKEKTEVALTAAGKQSKSSRKRGIRSNRSQEKQVERDNSAWKIGIADEMSANKSSVALRPEAIHQDTAEDYIPPSRKSDRIRAYRDREWQKDEK